jgi:DNA-binding response OmpR family regulator
MRKYQGPLHLLVTDLVMPQLGGVELAMELRRSHPSLRTLYLSGYTNDERLLARALEQGTHFLAKPFLPGDLLNTVRAVLESAVTTGSNEATH